MEYIHRNLEAKFLRYSDFFKIVLLTGARQVGKTTMLRHLAAGSDRSFVTLDDDRAREIAQNDPQLFFQLYPPPIVIDEVQYAPQLFPRMKLLADQTDARGLFWLTGSQHYAAIKAVQESLAGRIGFLRMYPLSQNEVLGLPYPGPPAFSLDDWLARQRTGRTPRPREVFADIWRGGMPLALNAVDEMRAAYFAAYVDTYLMRDVTILGNVQKLQAFRAFLTACAGLTGQQINYSKLAEIVSIDQTTAKSWTNLLIGLGVLWLLPPFASNRLKRLSRTPKLYFADTGLASYLCRWPDSQTLMTGPTSGAFLENYAVMDLVKLYAASKEDADFSYYRDQNGKEIDLIIETAGQAHPIEIKQGASPDRRETRKFDVLNKAGVRRGGGGIVCLSDQVYPASDEDCIIPIGLV